MRCLIVSDIHANWEALEAVLADAEGRHDQILCCGDLAGYGADPNAVVAWARRHAAVVIRGNHDKACTGLDDPEEWGNPVAAASARWTRATLEPENWAYLSELPRGPVETSSGMLVHGSPADEDQYVITLQDATSVANAVEAPRYFFGHTHIQGGFLFRGRRAGWLRGSTIEFEPSTRYLVNPGSVGQPRDGDPRAAYALAEDGGVEFRRVRYDVHAAASKIRAAGLPELLALRLQVGA